MIYELQPYLTTGQDGFITRNNYTGITVFRISAKHLDKWLEQNKYNSNVDYIDFADGCLLDNYIVSCKRGTAFIFESYVNSQCSDYTIYFLSAKKADNADNKTLMDKLYQRFNELIDEMGD